MRPQDYKLLADEAAVSAQLSDWLAVHGYLTLSTVERRKAVPCHCPECGHRFSVRSHEGSGIGQGVPDLIVRRPEWPRACLYGIESKRPSDWKWSSPGQKQAYEDGFFVVATDYEDLRLLRAMEEEPFR